MKPSFIPPTLRAFVLAAGFLSCVSIGQAASPPTVLFLDTFDAATANTTDLNVDLSRESGTLSPLTYSMAVNAANYGHQLQNVNAPNQLLVADFPQSTSSPDFNFNGVNSVGGLMISFDLDSMPTVYASTPDNWGCLNLGMGAADQLANVNQGVTHFGILFRAAGTLQAFDGAAVVSPAVEPTYTSKPAGTTNHIDLVITDSDGNPFDGVGSTIIEVFANGGALPVWSFTKAGGYANNYINVQGSFRAHFDNLTVTRLAADRAPTFANPSFEADTFTVFPGYVSGNGPITGWTALGGHGVNPGTFGGPFSDNGAIPDGTKVAFLQDDGALSQVVSGFSIGSTYQIHFFENARTGATAPACEVRVAGSTVLAAHSVTPVGGSNPYHEMVTDPFQATATAMEVAFVKSNPAGGDTTLLIDNVSVIAPNTKPTITQEPQDAFVVAGEPAVFTVAALGSAPLSFQWYFGQDPIGGETERTLTVPTDFPDVAGEYHVIVSNPSGSATSRVARLTFVTPLTGVFNTGVDDTGVAMPDGSPDTHYKLIVNPDNTGDTPLVENSTVFPIVTGPWVANNGGSKWIGPRLETSASAGGALDQGDYVYRMIVDAAGFDPASLMVSGGWSTDNAGLDILVNGVSTGQANPGGFGALASFSLTGFSAGWNYVDFKLNNSAIGYTGLKVDNIRAVGAALPAHTRPFIAEQPHDFTATISERVTFSVRANGSAPLSYQWFFGVDQLTGETGPVLSFILEFEDQGGQYSVEVSNADGSVHSTAATLNLRRAPAILTQPKSQTVAVGDPVTFSVVANGFEPLDYHWFKDNVEITGENAATLTIAAAATSDAGTYIVRVSNAAGSVTSTGAVLAVLEQAPPGVVFSTGVGPDGTALADGAVDPHYVLLVNPDGPSADALVEDSTVFPIVTGPWVANEDTSKWIGPRLETSGAAGGAGAAGDYTYRITFEIGGFDPASARLIGEWSTDNEGVDIFVNGTSNGQPNTGQFPVYTPFVLTAGFAHGANTVDFKLNNSAVGYTGLKVRNIRLLGIFRPFLHPLTIDRSGAAPVVHAVWEARVGKTYRLQFKDNLTDPNWSNAGADVTATGTTASQDQVSPGPQRFYRVIELQ